MRAYKKKFFAFLVTALTVGAMLVVCSAQSSTDESGSQKPEAKGQGPKFTTGSLFAGDPNFSRKQDNTPGNKELFYKMMLSVLLVVALGAAAIYTSRKLLPRISNLPGKEIRIVETVHIGPRKTLHLLKVGNQCLLLGSTGENITKLADVTDALADIPTQEIDPVRS
ncbi:MAG: FliO/MopB family protein [candidate division Zixibacteria bacterium]|nr:FliO/MopB family protein [candidate division Zixibacteria bacterium]